MLATHPESLRPDHVSGAFIDLDTLKLEAADVARRVAGVILDVTRDLGRQPEMRDFREAEATRGLAAEAILANLPGAWAIADKTTIRQVDENWMAPQAGPEGWPNGRSPGEGSDGDPGSVRGIPEAIDGMFEKTDDELLDIAAGECAGLITDDMIVGALLRRGLRPEAISRLWPRLTRKLALTVAGIAKPSIGNIAAQAQREARG